MPLIASVLPTLIAGAVLDIWQSYWVAIIMTAVAFVAYGLIEEIVTKKNVAAAIGLAALTVGALGFVIYYVPASRRHAIHRVLTYDQTMSSDSRSKASTIEYLFGPSSASKAEYVRRMRLIPLHDCPTDFAEVYRRHISAWEKGTTADITTTWNEVLATARRYEVDLASLEL